MKTLFIVIIIVIIGGFFFFFHQLNNSSVNTPAISIVIPLTSITPTISNLKIITVKLNDKNYIVNSLPIPQNKKIILIPNFTQKEFGQNIAEKENCSYAINGGFYTKNDTPLGLFTLDGKAISKEIQSNLVNGFFGENYVGTRFLEKTAPDNNSKLHFIFQSGPLVRVGNYQLKIVNDEMDRRSLIGKDGKNNYYMVSITQKENSLRGPLLSDIAQIFFQASIQKEIPFTQLLNLDGGSASFFYAKEQYNEFILSEITPVGSLLCVK